MAAHDDKISTNRRRLFKALSSVPVVMTLRPGSALANSSAYQCVRKAREEHSGYHWKDKTMSGHFSSCDSHDMCKDDTDGMLFKRLNYWHTTDQNDVIEVTDASVGCPEMVVEMEDGALVDLSTGQPVPSHIRKGGLSGDGRQILEVTKIDGSGNTVVCRKVVSQKGYGAYVGHTSNNDTNWHEEGFSPRYKPSSGTGMGESQKISDSCMTSFLNAKTSGLTNG